MIMMDSDDNYKIIIMTVVAVVITSNNAVQRTSVTMNDNKKIETRTAVINK